MNFKLLLGLAAAAGAVYFLRSEKGKAFLDSLADKIVEGTDKVADEYEEKLDQGADKLKALTHKVADTSNIPVEA